MTKSEHSSNPNWLTTKDGSQTLVHLEHGQTYHSLAGAWSECNEVFLKPVCDYATQQQWTEWKVLDVGFGLGLNWLCFVNHTKSIGQNLKIHSLERDAELLHLPTPQNLAERVLPESLICLEKFKSQREISESNLQATLHLSDANATLQRWQETQKPKFNIILQDAFSVQVNPELWDEAYFKRLAALCLPQAILVTYAAASSVQRALKAAGFTVAKYPGFGGKRERLVSVRGIV